jgi:putative ABC transport system substrate-binding protein
MNRRDAILVLLGLGAAPLTSVAQQNRIPRIGYLALPRLAEAPSAERAAFLEGLRELGYTQGRNIRIDYRSAEGKAELLPGLAAELVRENVDVIVATSAEPAKAAQAATRTIPIVFAASGDPVADGLVASLSHPGGNATGLSRVAPELAGKRLELLKEVLPHAKRVAVLRNRRNAAVEHAWPATQKAAVTLGLTLLPFELGQADSAMRTFESVANARADALLVLNDPRLASYSKIICDFAARNHIPAFGERSDFVPAGGLLSYTTDSAYRYRRAAAYVDKILKGARPADLPVEQPTRFELAINLKTAKALGLTIPQSLLFRADHVIE